MERCSGRKVERALLAPLKVELCSLLAVEQCFCSHGALLQDVILALLPTLWLAWLLQGYNVGGA